MSENNMKIASYILIIAALVVIISIFSQNIPSINSFITAIPSIFIISLAAVFLFDSVYFIENVDVSKTPLDVLLDVMIAVSLVLIAFFVYKPGMEYFVFTMLTAAFIISILKYVIAARHSNKPDVQKFIRNKASLDVLGAVSYVICAVVSFFSSSIAPYLLLATAFSYIAFMVYGTFSDFFNIKTSRGEI